MTATYLTNMQYLCVGVRQDLILILILVSGKIFQWNVFAVLPLTYAIK